MQSTELNMLSATLTELVAELLKQCPEKWLGLEVNGKVIKEVVLSQSTVILACGSKKPLKLSVDWNRKIKEQCEELGVIEKKVNKFTFTVDPTGAFNLKVEH